MADITDAEAVAFLNHRVRRMAELARKFKLEAQSLDAAWQLVSAKIPNTADTVVDGRADEGVHQVTGTQVNDVVYNLTVASNALVLATLEPFCVRGVEVV